MSPAAVPALSAPQGRETARQDRTRDRVGDTVQRSLAAVSRVLVVDADKATEQWREPSARSKNERYERMSVLIEPQLEGIDRREGFPVFAL